MIYSMKSKYEGCKGRWCDSFKGRKGLSMRFTASDQISSTWSLREETLIFLESSFVK